MFYYVVLIFVVTPVLELTLLKWLWEATSLPFTIGVVLITGFLGAWLARLQGLGAWKRIHQAMAQGRSADHAGPDHRLHRIRAAGSAGAAVHWSASGRDIQAPDDVSVFGPHDSTAGGAH